MTKQIILPGAENFSLFLEEVVRKAGMNAITEDPIHEKNENCSRGTYWQIIANGKEFGRYIVRVFVDKNTFSKYYSYNGMIPNYRPIGMAP